MQQLLNDLKVNVQGYYDSVVALLPKLALALLVFSLLWVIGKFLSRFTQNRLSRRLEDPLLVRFLSRLIHTITVLTALLIVLNIIGLGAAAAGLLGTAGVGAFVLGFAFKDIGEHFLAGIMLAFKRPFRVGDVVELNGIEGKVMTLNLRDTHLKTFDGKDVYVPNGNIIKNPVVNYTIDGYIRYDFEIGLDYGSDIDQAIEIIRDVLNNIPEILQEDKAPSVVISTPGTSTLNLIAYYWLDTFDKSVSAQSVKTKAINGALEALTKAGYYLPGDIIELKNYNSEPLSQRAQQ
jgi:small-conductance mechanosensitive channel